MIPLISIVITTKNEEKNIANCLKSIRDQTYKNIEIIVVDNNSTDKTKQIISSFSHSRSHRHSREGGNPVYNHISFFTHGPERSAQRNFGVRRAKGEYILYLDADMILSKDVVKDCVIKIQNNPDVIALYISEIVMGESFWGKVRRFERSFYDGTVIDCVRFVSKKAFEAVGGFDENLTGPEDWDLDRKLRNIGKVELIKTPIFHNETGFDLKKYLAKKAFYAKNFDTYINKWSKSDVDVKKQFGFWYRYFGVFIENGKWKKLLSHPLLSLGMYFLRYSIGLVFVSTLFRKEIVKNYREQILINNTSNQSHLKGKKPLVSVILPVKKYIKELNDVIDSVFNQSYKNFEFILVTPELSPDIKSLKNKYNLIIKICEGKNRSRNYGCRIAKGIYLLHIDEDMILDPAIIAECISMVNVERARTVVIPEKENESKGIINKTRVLEKKIVSHDTIIESPRFIERKLFEDIGGFNELLDPIDDGDLKAKLEEKKIDNYRIESEIKITSNNGNSHLLRRFRYYFERGKKAPLFNAMYPYSKQLKPLDRLMPYFIYRKYLFENLGISIVLLFLNFLDLIILELGALFVSKEDKKIIAEIRNNKLYENTANTYQKEFYEDALGGRYVNNKEKEIVLKYLSNFDNGAHLKILDIGAGGGRWSKLLLERFPNARIMACDLSQKMVKNLFVNLKNFNKRFDATVADMQNLPFKDGEFDLVLSIRAIKYAPKQTKVFNEINRVLKSDGTAIIELPNYNFAYKIIKYIRIFGILSDYANRIVLKDREEIEKNLQKNRFKIKSLEICFTVPSTLYKNINNEAILSAINSFEFILPKKFFGRSLFYKLMKDSK